MFFFKKNFYLVDLNKFSFGKSCSGHLSVFIVFRRRLVKCCIVSKVVFCHFGVVYFIRASDDRFLVRYVAFK